MYYNAIHPLTGTKSFPENYKNNYIIPTKPQKNILDHIQWSRINFYMQKYLNPVFYGYYVYINK